MKPTSEPCSTRGSTITAPRSPLKCEGLTDDQLRIRSVPPSNLSLLGLVRHMAEVELNWFRFWLAGEEPNPRYEDDDEFRRRRRRREEASSYWRSECEHAREVVAPFDSLDDVGAGQTLAPVSRCAGRSCT